MWRIDWVCVISWVSLIGVSYYGTWKLILWIGSIDMDAVFAIFWTVLAMNGPYVLVPTLMVGAIESTMGM